ncbi:unnamed protein product [Ectocarpus sp. 13 AM-2016]
MAAAVVKPFVVARAASASLPAPGWTSATTRLGPGTCSYVFVSQLFLSRRPMRLCSSWRSSRSCGRGGRQAGKGRGCKIQVVGCLFISSDADEGRCIRIRVGSITCRRATVLAEVFDWDSTNGISFNESRN